MLRSSSSCCRDGRPVVWLGWACGLILCVDPESGLPLDFRAPGEGGYHRQHRSEREDRLPRHHRDCVHQLPSRAPRREAGLPGPLQALPRGRRRLSHLWRPPQGIFLPSDSTPTRCHLMLISGLLIRRCFCSS